MELTKQDKATIKPVIRKGINAGCQKWLDEMDSLIRSEYTDEENAFDRCMRLTKESRDFYKAAMEREQFYATSWMLGGVACLLREGNLTWEDVSHLRKEILDTLHRYVDEVIQ